MSAAQGAMTSAAGQRQTLVGSEGRVIEMLVIYYRSALWRGGKHRVMTRFSLWEGEDAMPHFRPPCRSSPIRTHSCHQWCQPSPSANLSFCRPIAQGCSPLLLAATFSSILVLNVTVLWACVHLATLQSPVVQSNINLGVGWEANLQL